MYEIKQLAYEDVKLTEVESRLFDAAKSNGLPVDIPKKLKRIEFARDGQVFAYNDLDKYDFMMSMPNPDGTLTAVQDGRQVFIHPEVLADPNAGVMQTIVINAYGKDFPFTIAVAAKYETVLDGKTCVLMVDGVKQAADDAPEILRSAQDDTAT